MVTESGDLVVLASAGARSTSASSIPTCSCRGGITTSAAPLPWSKSVSPTTAGELAVSPKPLLVGVSVAAAFLTPVATPANLMVLEPGGYRFGDYWKLGLPLLALFGVVAVLLVPVFWAF